MNYISLSDPFLKVSFKDAVLAGQAPRKGLFFPETVPGLSQLFLNELKHFSKEEIAYQVIKPFTGNEIQTEDLRNIISETLNFDFPLVQIDEHTYCLELFHGPTGAFKDVGARFMSGCVNYFIRNSDKKLTILVATSGDTGGAVADAFFKSENVDVIILFPSKKVSHLQELQLTTLGENIRAIEVEGTFDDCQSMVKEAFNDQLFSDKYHLSSANSINIARWLSQQFYYFLAIKQWPLQAPPAISVPSGNLGNISAGMLAKKSGLNIDILIAGCNENDSLVEYLATGNFNKKKTIPTISNAMDVGNPSNFSRILPLLNGSSPLADDMLLGYSINSEKTRNAISEVYKSKSYIMDPHGAVGYLALQEFLNTHQGKSGIFLETAHPAKFKNIVNPLVNGSVETPALFSELEQKNSDSTKISPDYHALKEVLL